MTTWNSFVIEEGARVEAVRSSFDGAKILTVDATVTQAECTAAVEAARAISCLARAGCICFDLDGKLIEDYNENRTRKRNEMKADSEGRWKKKEEISRPSHSLSSSFQEDIFDSDSAEEMDQKHRKLGAKPNWCAHADWPNMSGDESFTTTVPPLRDHTLSGGSQQQEQSKDCQNSEEVESCSNMKLY